MVVVVVVFVFERRLSKLQKHDAIVKVVLLTKYPKWLLSLFDKDKAAAHNAVVDLDAEKARESVGETPMRSRRRMHDKQRLCLMKRRLEDKVEEKDDEDGEEDEEIDVEMDDVDVNIDVDDYIDQEKDDDEEEVEDEEDDDDVSLKLCRADVRQGDEERDFEASVVWRLMLVSSSTFVRPACRRLSDFYIIIFHNISFIIVL